MKRYLLTILVLGLFAVQGFAQDNPAPADADEVQARIATPPEQMAAPAAAEEAVEPQEISIYGEVKSIDTASGTITVQYYDYDSDEEKSIAIVVDQSVKMENAASISDIKQGNWADVIYTVKNGKNIATSVIIEKDEEPAAEMAQVEDTAQTFPNQ